MIAILSTALSPILANAQEKGQRRGPPPPEAIEACTSQVEAAACSFTGQRGDITGTCMVSPRGQDQLICAPEGAFPRN